MKFIKRNLPIVIGGLILISIVGILIVDKNSHPTQGPQLQKVEEAALIASHTYIQGNPKAPITLVGFMDLSNPECAEIYRAIKVFQELYPNRLRFALRHYPNTDASKDAALAAQVAGDQGKFWEYVEVLFANQQKGFDKPALLEYAKTIGLDTQKFETYLDDKTLLSDITTDAQAAEIFSAKNVPTIFLNERKMAFVDVRDFKTQLENELSKYAEENSTEEATPSTSLPTYEETSKEAKEILEVSYTTEGWKPLGTIGYVGQTVRFINTTDSAIIFEQLDYKFPEFKEEKVIKAGEFLEFTMYRDRLWRFQEKLHQSWGAIYIRAITLPTP